MIKNKLAVLVTAFLLSLSAVGNANQPAEATTPAGDQLELLSHDGHFFLTANGSQLKTSFAHGTEEELAKLGCAQVRGATKPHVLIGGLGLAYTLAEACRVLPQKGAEFTVAELIPEIVSWNKSHLAHLHPGLWDDPRVRIHHGNVGALIASSEEAFSVMKLPPEKKMTPSIRLQD